MSVSVCLCVCVYVPVSPRSYLRNYTSDPVAQLGEGAGGHAPPPPKLGSQENSWLHKIVHGLVAKYP